VNFHGAPPCGEGKRVKLRAPPASRATIQKKVSAYPRELGIDLSKI